MLTKKTLNNSGLSILKLFTDKKGVNIRKEIEGECGGIKKQIAQWKKNIVYLGLSKGEGRVQCNYVKIRNTGQFLHSFAIEAPET